MEKGLTREDLKERIQALENKKTEQEVELKKEFHKTYEMMKPVNLIKNSIKDLTTSPEIRGSVTDAIISLSAGYLSKKLAVGSSKNPIKLLLGTLLQSVVTTGVAQNSEAIKSTVLNFIQEFLNKTEKTSHE
jgi:hypothetical protein